MGHRFVKKETNIPPGVEKIMVNRGLTERKPEEQRKDDKTHVHLVVLSLAYFHLVVFIS